MPASFIWAYSWVVMSIMNSIARRGSPRVLVPPSLGLEEQTLWESSTAKVACAECIQMCTKNSGLKARFVV